MGVNVSGLKRTTPGLLGGEPAFKEPLYITRSLAPDEERFGALVGQVFASRRFTNDGEILRELEDRLRRRLDVAFCAAFCNGTVALQVALRALDLSGQVITTPFTFPATLHAIAWNGLEPVFCDVDPRTYNLDVYRAEELVSSRTSALLPVHVFGNPCDVESLGNLAERFDLRVIYDAAHAFGVTCSGRAIGNWGDLSVLSFHATKLFHTAEGGAIVSSKPEVLSRIKMLRNFGILDEEHVSGVGLNGKLSEIHASVGLSLLDRVDGEIAARERLAEQYRARLEEVEGIGWQTFHPQSQRNHAYLAIEIEAEQFGLSRNQVHMALRAENIITRKYFFPLCSENEAYRGLASATPDRLPNAHRLASRILCLPLYGDLEADDVDAIVDALLDIQDHAPAIRRIAVEP